MTKATTTRARKPVTIEHEAPSTENIEWVEGTGELVGAGIRKGKEVAKQVPVVAKSFWAGVLKGYNG